MPRKSKYDAARAQIVARNDAVIEMLHHTIADVDDQIRILRKTYNARWKVAQTNSQMAVAVELQCGHEHRMAIAAACAP